MKPGIVELFSKSINDEISRKGANVMVFFMPTDGASRVECLNPVLLSEVEMCDVNRLLVDIRKFESELVIHYGNNKI